MIWPSEKALGLEATKPKLIGQETDLIYRIA